MLKDCTKPRPKEISMVDQGADQNWTVAEGYIGWNECKILLESGADMSVVKDH